MQAVYQYIKTHFSLVALLFIMAAILVVVTKEKRWNDRIIQYDTVHYYGYLPSTFIYKNLSLEFTDTNEKYLANKIFYSKTESGKKVFKVSMGISICYLPFFLMAHTYATLSGTEATGFSAPYKFALVWSAVVFVFIGLIYLRKILRLWFSEVTVGITLCVCLFATNLFFYVCFEGTMSHAYSFAILTLFLWKIIQWHKKPTYQSSIIIGLLIGWLFLIRPTHLLILFIFLGWGVHNFSSAKDNILKFLTHWKKLILMGVFAFIFCIPQLLYWKVYSGDWLFYSYVGERFFFLHPHILEGLFSWRKGWLLYTPVMVLSIAGLFFLPKKVPDFSRVYIIFLVILLYITWSWWCWWYGGGFGQRSLVDWYGLMSIPIACLLERIRLKKIIFSGILVFSIACTGLNFFQYLQYKNTTLHYDSMTSKAYFYHFFSISKYPGLTPLLKQPDYSKAMKGEKEYYWE
jgi:hypothetical protein